MRIKKFISDVQKKLAKHNFVLELKNVDFLVDKIGKNKTVRCRAFFDESDRKIVIAEKAKIPVHLLLAHEYSHFVQYQKKTSAYKKSEIGYSTIYKYISGSKKLNQKQVYKYLTYCIEYELEAEKMAFDLLQKYNIKFDKKSYIREANLYLYSWGSIYYDKNSGDIIDKEIPNNIEKEFMHVNHYIMNSKNILKISV